MSAIYFHSPSAEARVSGAERARAQLLCTEYLLLALGVSNSFAESEVYRKLLPPHAYPLASRDERTFFDAFRTYCHGFLGDASLLMPGTGRTINLFDAALNTSVAGGSDAIRLLAKLHAQSEIHCYVEGKNRAWLADVIAQGVKNKTLRTWEKYDVEGVGWQSVADLLQMRDDEPVVTSYSICEQFPNFSVAHTYGDFSPSMETLKAFFDAREDENVRAYGGEREAFNPEDEELVQEIMSEYWDGLPVARQWTTALKGLRKANKKGQLEIDPVTFAVQGYGDGLSGFDIYAALTEQRHD